MKIEKTVGPITFKFGGEAGLRKRDKIVSITIGVILYWVTCGFSMFIGINTWMSILAGSLFSIVSVIGLKKYFMYTYAKENRKSIELE